MICKVRKTVEKYNMLRKGCTVIAGLSGGADSCALLYALLELKDEYELQIIAAHVNHGIRGAEAQRDEDFAAELCEKNGVDIRVLHCDVPLEAEKAGMGTEEYGRKIRYEFFESICENGIIATAHNLNDCCETLLFNIARGTTLSGIKSIPPVRGNIIRPLIECSRTEIEQYCALKGIQYVTDSTNCDDSYSRNRIRLNVIPQLKKINPSFEKSVLRPIDSARADDDYLNLSAMELVDKSKTKAGYNADILNSAHISLKKRAIEIIIRNESGLLPESIHIENVCSILSGGKTQIAAGLEVTVRNGLLTFGKENLTKQWECHVCFDKEIITPCKSLSFAIVNKSEQVKQYFVHKNVLDFDCIDGELIIRSRLPGDMFRQAGRKCTKTLKKLFTENKIHDKNSVCVLADSKGVLWVEGFGCDERCRITGKTERILRIDKNE